MLRLYYFRDLILPTMPDILLQTHSYLRYFVMIMLLIVVAKSIAGWGGNRPYTGVDNKLGLYLVIFTHLQFLAGIILYFISPLVQFNAGTMKEDLIRYWTVEHAFAMIIAIALITAARSTARRVPDDRAKHKRLAVFNSIALILIVGTLAMSGRGII